MDDIEVVFEKRDSHDAAAAEEELAATCPPAPDEEPAAPPRQRGWQKIVIALSFAVFVVIATVGGVLVSNGNNSDSNNDAKEGDKTTLSSSSPDGEGCVKKCFTVGSTERCNDDCIKHPINSTIEEEPSIFDGPLSEFMVSNTTRSSGLSCKSDEGKVRFTLLTDKYGFETSWKITNMAGRRFAYGPPGKSKYAGSTQYIGVLCLSKGRYSLEINDIMGDGLCCNYGRGKSTVAVNGKMVVNTGSENFQVKKYSFVVGGTSTTTPTSIVNNEPINSGKECSVVKPIDYNKKFQRGRGYQTFPGYSCYRTVEGTKMTVNDLLAKYPQLTRKATLGNFRTVEKNELLYALVITNKQSSIPRERKGKMLMTASIHSREIATGETVTRFAEHLLQNYGDDPEVSWILDYTEIHIIPHANPDGRKYLERGGVKTLWAKNRNNNCNRDSWRYGVNNNRNFPFMWGKCDDSGQRCGDSDQCDHPAYRGPRANSEQETKAIVQYMSSVFPSSQRKGNLQTSEANHNNAFPQSNQHVFLDIHSHGQDIGWPWLFKNKKSPNDSALGALGRKMASFSQYSLWAPDMRNRLYGLGGSTIDFAHGHLGAASYFYELGTSFYQPCESFPDVINEAFPGFMYAAKVATQPYIAPRGPDILCTSIDAVRKSTGIFINVRVQVSDDARTKHADDGGSIFQTGRQTIKSVEVFVNCHPYSGSNCSPVAKKSLQNAGKTTTVSLQFKAPAGGNKNVMYIRAKDSANYAGPITARHFASY